MKILSIDKIREADRYTIEHEPIRSVDLMERAAGQVFEWLKHRIKKENKIKIFCGMGNNGGDGLAVARLLANEGFATKKLIQFYTKSREGMVLFGFFPKKTKRPAKSRLQNQKFRFF